MSTSPYLFPAAEHPLHAEGEGLKVREAISGFGIALRYQERVPEPPGTDDEVGDGTGDAAADGGWCLTGHSVFVLSGRIRYVFDSHTVEAGPGDMLHIPAGPEHRHKPRAIGEEPVRYVLTTFE